MEVVVRPANDRFLQEVMFPPFEYGLVAAAPGLEHLLAHVADPDTRMLIELVHDNCGADTFFGLEDERWNQALYRLLFFEWFAETGGWTATQAQQGFAGQWEDTFHLALMLEDATYPYDRDEEADVYRRTFWGTPQKAHGLSTFLCGAWDPVPRFPPDQVLTVEGHGQYSPEHNIARADWTWRPMLTVNRWAAKLPGTLSRLLDREVKRLAPIDPPERHEILDYWLGRVPEPPILAVSFSGLGPKAMDWIRDIGVLAQLIRHTAAQQQGLTCVLGMPRRGRDH